MAFSDLGQGPGAVSCEYDRELQRLHKWHSWTPSTFQKLCCMEIVTAPRKISQALLPTLKQRTHGFTAVTSLGLQPIPLLHSFQWRTFKLC